MSPGDPLILGSKGQRSRSPGTKICRFSDVMQYTTGCIRKQQWVFPVAMPHRPPHKPCERDRVFPASRPTETDRRFFHACSFSQSASSKQIAGVGHGSRVSAGFF